MILDRLPSMGGSHFVDAQRNDPEVAEYVLDMVEANPEAVERGGRPRGVEWTYAHELHAQTIDLLGSIGAMIASHPLPRKAKPRKAPRPYPRPTRAIDLAKARRRNRRAAELDAEVEQAKERWRKQQSQQQEERPGTTT